MPVQLSKYSLESTLNKFLNQSKHFSFTSDTRFAGFNVGTRVQVAYFKDVSMRIVCELGAM